MSDPGRPGASDPGPIADHGRRPVAPGGPVPPTSDQDPTTTRPDEASRPTDLRLARVHLRMGALDLARAELEAFAGAGSLDPEALVDLAEVRWRTGDLGGAGVAAEAYLEADREDPVALVIAAEAAAASARYGEARKMAARTIELVGDDLDGLFAGMPRSAVWPADRHAVAASADGLFGDEARPRTTGGDAFIGAVPVPPQDGIASAMAGDRPVGELDAPPADLAGQPGLWGPAAPGAIEAGPAEASPGPASAGPTASSGPVASPDAFAAAREAMVLGDQEEAARRLADLIRQQPDLAATVLGALPAAADRTAADEPVTRSDEPDPSDPSDPPD